MATLAFPAVNRATVQRSDELIARLQKLVPAGHVVHDEASRRAYAADAFADGRVLPLAVVMPTDPRQVSQVLRYCYETGLKIAPRGAGTSLTGAAIASEDGIVLCLSRMNRILDLNEMDRIIQVEPGVTTAEVRDAAAVRGLLYAPDPSSADAATIGGNIATNAAGARGLKYGATGSHVLALKIVLCDGELIEIGGGELEPAGYDLVGLVAGSEGLLGVIVEATLRLLPSPVARQLSIVGFESVSAALSCAAGLMTAELPLTVAEVLDRNAIAVCEQFAHAGLPTEAGALLICEVEGCDDELAELAAEIDRIGQAHGAQSTRHASDGGEADGMWRAYHSVLAALGRLGEVRCIDIAVPPSRLDEATAALGDIAARYGLRGANLFRAGDGLVRSVFFGSEDRDEGDLAAAVDEAARAAVRLGGIISGDHGIGAYKREALVHQFPDAAMNLQLRLKSAFDTEWLLGHGKVFPLAEQARMTET